MEGMEEIKRLGDNHYIILHHVCSRTAIRTLMNYSLAGYSCVGQEGRLGEHQRGDYCCELIYFELKL